MQLAERIQRKKAQLARLEGPTASDAAMANSFPLGGGFGRRGGAKKLDATIDRAVKAVKLRHEIVMLESRLNQPARPVNPKPVSTVPASDKPHGIRVGLRCDGKHTLSTGAVLDWTRGWEAGVVTLTAADGSQMTEAANGESGKAMEDAAVRLAKRHLSA